LTATKYIAVIVLSSPAAHYISGWRPRTKTFHPIKLLTTDFGFIEMGEGIPYGSTIAKTYAKVIQGLTLEDALNALVPRDCDEFERSKLTMKHT